MDEWIKVSQKDVNRPFKSKVKGISVTMMSSPFDVPVKAGFGFDEIDGCFFVEFKYLSSKEPKKRIDRDDGVNFIVGKKSEKVYRLEIDYNHFKATSASQIDLNLALEEAKFEVKKFDIKNRKVGNISAITNFLSGQIKKNYAEA